MLHQAVNSFHLLGAYFSEEFEDIVMYIPWGTTRILSQGWTIVSWPAPHLSLHHLPSLISNFPSVPKSRFKQLLIREGRESYGDWSLCPTNMKWVTQKDSVPRSPVRSYSASLLPLYNRYIGRCKCQSLFRRFLESLKQHGGRADLGIFSVSGEYLAAEGFGG